MTLVPVTALMGIVTDIREEIVTHYHGDRGAIMPLRPRVGPAPANECEWVMPLMSLVAGGPAESTARAALRYWQVDADGQECGSARLELLDRMPESAFEIQSSDASCPPRQLLLLSVGKDLRGGAGHEDRYTWIYSVLGQSGYPGGFRYVEYREYVQLVMGTLAQFNEAIAKLPADGITFRESLRTFEFT